MNALRPATGTAVRMDYHALGSLISVLRNRGYQVIGPTLKDSAITYGPIEGLDDLPAGWTTEQARGSYRVKPRPDGALFGFAVGPKSLKNFLHPSEIKLLSAERTNGTFRILANVESVPRYAFLGVRACEIAAAGIQDRVLIDNRYSDPVYRERRGNSIVIAVQCSDAAETCFCASMGTGPRARAGFDLALTEWIDGESHEFLVEIGTELGADLLEHVECEEAPEELHERSELATRAVESKMIRRLEKSGLAELPRDNFNHPHWDDIAARCLACGNCTMVCPTCFCVTVEDTSDITGEHAERWRKWDSCFTLSFTHVHTGSVRVSTKSRYRQWLTHKLSYWNDQFGSAGCVGCGRCISWCPVGIDLTQEVAALQAAVAAEKTKEMDSDCD